MPTASAAIADSWQIDDAGSGGITLTLIGKLIMTQLQSLISGIGDNTPLKEVIPDRESLKHIVVGSAKAVTSTIHNLQILGYAEVGDWSPLLPSGNPGEVMSILIRQILIK